MAKFIKLKQPPIKEIIFTISFIENVEENVFDKFVSLPAIKKVFPVINRGFNAKLEAVNNQLPTTKVSVDGFVLMTGIPHTKLLQTRKGSLSLHLVNQYENFNILIEELATYWNLLEECNRSSLTVNGISVRYLNFIELKENEKVGELINIFTEHPFGTKQVHSFSQHRFTYEKNQAITINVVSTTGKSEQKDGIILDIILNKKIDNSNKFDFDSFTDMREAKNDIFFKSITEKTINIYNQ